MPPLPPGAIDHRTLHFPAGLALMVATLALMGAVRNRHLRRRLLISFAGWLLFVAIHLVMTMSSLLAYTEVLQHVSLSLDNIQNILLEHLESQQEEDHNHIEEMHKAISISVEAHRKELEALTALVNSTRQNTRPSPSTD